MTQKKKRFKSFSLLDIYKGLRKGWKINPKTKIKKSKKIYNRAKAKKEFRKELEI